MARKRARPHDQQCFESREECFPIDFDGGDDLILLKKESESVQDSSLPCAMASDVIAVSFCRLGKTHSKTEDAVQIKIAISSSMTIVTINAFGLWTGLLDELLWQQGVSLGGQRSGRRDGLSYFNFHWLPKGRSSSRAASRLQRPQITSSNKAER